MNKKIIKQYAALHLVFFIYSLCGICTKAAAGSEFLSLRFCIFYGLELVILFVYAIIWQQIIKRMPLTTAFSNKGVTVIWAMIWGSLLFHEHIGLKNMIGAVLVIGGIILFAKAGESDE